MALHERKGDDAFENDDRRDDDEKGAGVESFGKDLANEAKKAGDVGVFAKATIAGEDAGRAGCRFADNRRCSFHPRRLRR